MNTVKYHISPKLGPMKCSVTVGVCHFPDSEHFENFEKAQTVYDAQLVKKNSLFACFSKNDHKDVQAVFSQMDSKIDESNKGAPTDSIFWSENETERNVDNCSVGVQKAAVQRILSSLENEPEITRDMVSSLRKGVRLEDLAFRVKSPHSVIRKLTLYVAARSGGKTVNSAQLHGVANGLTDIVRYTCVSSSHDAMVPMIQQQSQSLLDKGYVVKKADHSYVDGNSFKGVSIIWESRDQGEQFEVQYISEDAAKVKIESHNYYSAMRDRSNPVNVRKANEVKCIDLYSQVSKPRGLDEITHVGGVPMAVKTYKKL